LLGAGQKGNIEDDDDDTKSSCDGEKSLAAAQAT
jgi:hypothetical protein